MTKLFYKTSLLLSAIACFSVSSFAKREHAPNADVKMSQKTEFSFIENKGQWDDQVKYKAEIPEGAMFLTDKGFVYNYVNTKDFENVHEFMNNSGDFANAVIHQHAYKVNFINANANPKYEITDKRQNYNNYFIGDDQSKWKSNVGLFGKVTQQNIYNGIDLAVYSKGLVLKYDFIVAPNAAANQIAMSYEGVTPIITATGNLKIKTSVNEIMEQAPYSYQIIDGKEIEVKSNFKLRDGTVSFEFPNGYNKDYALVIDPVLVFVTYSGGVGSGYYSFSTTYDALGNMYAGAQAYGIGWPTTTGAIQSTYAGAQDVAVNKYNATGSALIYSTYYGGSGVDLPHAMKVNAQDELVVTGSTTSSNLPTTTGAHDNTLGGSVDIFVAHFNNLGTVLLGASYVGGNSTEPIAFSLTGAKITGSSLDLADQNTTSPLELDFDHDGNIWIVSSTQSADFPVILPPAYSTYTRKVRICPGGSYSFGTQTLTTAGTYVDTFTTTACDSIVTLTLSVSSLVDTFNASICAGTNYVLGTQTLTTPGTYTEVFPVGSCDSTVTINLTVAPLHTDSISAVICAGSSYTFGSNNLTTSGIYADTISTSGCDSIVVLDLLVNPYLTQTLNETICTNNPYKFGARLLTAPGVYTDTFPTVGCDKIVTLHLTTGTKNTYTRNETICTGGSYVLGNRIITTPGTYYDTVTTTGCDEITKLVLTSGTTSTYTEYRSICPGDAIYFGSQVLSDAGVYSETFPTEDCDSFVVLNLFVKPYTRDTLNEKMCTGGSYSFGGSLITSPGTYTDTFSTANCDSIVTLHLTTDTLNTYTVNKRICPGGSYVFGSQTLTTAGVYVDTFSTSGCDSIVTLNLSMDYIRNTIKVVQCAGQDFGFGTQTIEAPGIYIDTFSTAACDSIVTLIFQQKPYVRNSIEDHFCPGSAYIFGTKILTFPGVYVDTFSTSGCDSIVTLTLNQLPVYTDIFTQTACPGTNYVLGTQIISTPGSYTEIFNSVFGCDSIVTVDITFGTYVNDTITETMCPNANYYFGTHVLTTPGLYKDTFNTGTCRDSIVTLILNSSLSPTLKGGIDGVVFQLDPTCSNMMFSGYLGGTNDDGVVGIQINSDSNIVVCGPTRSANFPTTAMVMNPIAPGGTFDGFVSIIKPQTGGILHSTYLGTTNTDQAVNLQIDENDNIYVLGRTLGNYPISPNTFNVANGDLFIDKITPDLSTSILSTRVGAAQTSAHFFPAAFLLDVCGNTYVTGLVATAGMPLSPDAIQTSTQPFWFGVFTADFADLFYGSYFGTGADHTHTGVSRMDPEGIVYHSICNNTPTYPLATSASNPNPYRLNKPGNDQDVVSFKFNFEATGVKSHFQLDPLLNPKDTGCVPFTVTFENTSTAALTYLWEFGDVTQSTQTNPTHTFTTPGVYDVTLRAYNPNTCITEDSTTVRIVVLETALPDIVVSDTTVCRTLTSLDLSVTVNNPSPNNLFQWGPPNGILSASDQATVTVNPVLNNVFFVTVKDTIPGICGFSVTDTIHIDYAPRGLDILNNDTTVCEGTVIQINAQGTDGYAYSWSPTTGVSDSTILNPKITLNEPNVYLLTASHGGCPDTSTYITFDVQPYPHLTLSNDTSVCHGVPISLRSDVTPYRDDYTYQWSPASGLNSTSNPNVELVSDTTITYQLHAQTPIGCADSASVIVVVFPVMQTDAIQDTGYCPPGAVNLWANGGAQYQWVPGYGLNNTEIENPIANPATTTDYTVYITDQYGCKDSQNVNVQVYPLAVLEMPESVNIYPGESYQLLSNTNALYFQWFPPSGINDPTLSDPTFNPEVRTRYFVTATTEHGCEIKDSIDILVNESVIDVPNAFTPGNDLNGKFKAVNRGIYKLNNFSVFNRWGNKVFSTSNINEGWDGTYKGTPQPMGVYMYIIDAQSESGKRFQQNGNVTLIR